MSAMAAVRELHMPQLLLSVALLLSCIAATASPRPQPGASLCASCPVQAALLRHARAPALWRGALLLPLSLPSMTALAGEAPSAHAGGNMLPLGWLAGGGGDPLPLLLPLLALLAIAAALGFAGWRRRRHSDTEPRLALPAESLVRTIGRPVSEVAGGQELNLEARRAEIAAAVAELLELAAQTRLMALNASTEAAGAGPAGQVIARAAERVDRLACQVVRTAEEIGRAIEALGGEGTARTVAAVDRAGESWPAGIALARVHEAALVTREQGGGSEAAARKLDSVASIIEQVGASLRQTALVLDETIGQTRH